MRSAHQPLGHGAPAHARSPMPGAAAAVAMSPRFAANRTPRNTRRAIKVSSSGRYPGGLPMHDDQSFQSFADFYPFYLSEHSNRGYAFAWVGPGEKDLQPS